MTRDENALLNRPEIESVSLASLSRQLLWYMQILFL